MPCSCAGEDAYYAVLKNEELEKYKQLFCNAQEAMHRLGLMVESCHQFREDWQKQSNVRIPDDLSEILSLHRGMLLSHKKDEVKADIEELEMELEILKRKEDLILKNGGFIGKNLELQMAELEEKISQKKGELGSIRLCAKWN